MKIPYPCDFEHEHGRSQYMPGIVAPELDARHLLLLVEVDRLNLVHGRLQVAVCEQLLVRRDVGHLDVVAEHPEEDGLGRVCHVALALEGGLLKEPGQGSSVVKVEVRDQQKINLARKRSRLRLRCNMEGICRPDPPLSCRQREEHPCQ